MRTKRLLLAAVLVILLGSVAAAQVQGIPVDIPGTGMNFFLYRYEGEQIPHDKVNVIWANLTNAFAEWVEQGQEEGALTGDDVRILSDASGAVEIYIKRHFIVEVDEYHAEINKATRQQLAEKWAANLSQAVEKFITVNVPLIRR